MSLRFPYIALPLAGPAPPTLPAGSVVRWRPLIPIRIGNLNTGQFLNVSAALIDTGADDTVFPMRTAATLGIPLLPWTPPGYSLRWRGSSFAIRFGEVRLELADGIETWSWTALVAFSPAPFRHPLLGHTGFLPYIDVTFSEAARAVVLESSPAFAGTKT